MGLEIWSDRGKKEVVRLRRADETGVGRERVRMDRDEVKVDWNGVEKGEGEGGGGQGDGSGDVGISEKVWCEELSGVATFPLQSPYNRLGRNIVRRHCDDGEERRRRDEESCVRAGV